MPNPTLMTGTAILDPVLRNVFILDMSGVPFQLSDLQAYMALPFADTVLYMCLADVLTLASSWVPGPMLAPRKWETCCNSLVLLRRMAVFRVTPGYRLSNSFSKAACNFFLSL